MNHSKAEEDLRVVTGLLHDWAHSRRISGLEYDLLLDKLKELYELVRFADVTGASEDKEPSCPAAAEPSPAVVAEPVAAHEAPAAPTHQEEAAPAEPSPAAPAEPITEPTPGPAAEEAAPAAGTGEKDIHRRTVRALYDDERPVSDEDAAETLRMMSDALGAVCCAAEQRRAVAEQSRHGAEASRSGEHVVRAAVLGETIGHGTPTVADRLQTAAPRTTADVCRGHVASLREMIGLNDRYLLIKELFNGDAVAYEEAITRLDGMTSIEDAIIWLNDRYQWDGDGAAVQLLSDMLVRKLM